jgi:ParB family chromosome partitioning protein
MLANKIVQQDLSVRDVENLVKKLAQNSASAAQKTAVNHDVLALENSLSEKIGASVNISAKQNGSGLLKISYANLDQLDDIIRKISR